jgi:chemotaxis protein MotD
MTATPGLPIQQTAPSRPARPSTAADQSRGSGSASDRQGFEAVVSRLRGAPDRAPSAGDAGQTGGTRVTRSRPLKAEDVLPLEMLQTLYAQQQAMPLPQPIMPPGIQNGVAQPPALPDLTQLQGSAAMAGQPGMEMLTQAAADADAQGPQSGASSGAAPVLPALPQTSMPSSATALPPDFAQQLAAATRSGTPAAAPQPGRRASQPGMEAAPLLAAPDADTGGPTSASVMRPVQLQTASMAESRQALAAIPADESATARAEFADLLARQAEGGARRDGPGGQAEQLRDTPMVVTLQDTMLPPGQPPIAHQAAEKIIAELRSADNAAASDRAQLSRQSDGPAPARVLQLQLQPADLGTLTVTLSMRDQMLDIKLEAAEQRTAHMLETDREKLTEILRSAGYALDGVTVQISSPEKPVQSFHGLAGQGADGQAQQGGQPQSGGAQADAQRGQQSSPGNGDRSFASRTDGGDHGPRRGSADGDLYL